MINVTPQDIQFMVEDITSDLAYMLVEKQHYSIEQAIDVVYKSKLTRHYPVRKPAYIVKVPVMYMNICNRN